MVGAGLEHVLRRDRAVVLAALAALTAVTWAYVVWLAASMDMGGMPMPDASGMGEALRPAFRPWTAVDFAAVFVMWTVMMVGMMTPSAAPMILVYAAASRRLDGHGRPLAATGFFAGGYLVAWTVFSLGATAGQWLLERAALLTDALSLTGDVAGALVLIAAGVFQWLPAKDVCLRHCQSPFGFLVSHGVRGDARGALALGVRQGAYCVGCCWALMALLFVGGVMNVVWIAGLAIFVLVEKLVPSARIVTRAGGAGLIAWGCVLLVAAVR